jgi:hypothetical protein
MLIFLKPHPLALPMLLMLALPLLQLLALFWLHMLAHSATYISYTLLPMLAIFDCLTKTLIVTQTPTLPYFMQAQTPTH